MKLPEYTGQKTGIFWLPTFKEAYTSDRWKACIGPNYKNQIWQVKFPEHSFLEFFWWCEENCKEGLIFIHQADHKFYIGFANKDDAVHFKLKWYNV